MNDSDVWTRLEDPARTLGPARWEAARLTAHWAAQLAAAPGAGLATPAPDFGHLALTWLPRERLLAGPAIEPAGGARAALGVADASLRVLENGGDERAALRLEGRTLGEALRWLAETLGSAELDLPEERPPEHPLAAGAVFEAPDRAALSRLEQGYENAAGLLEELRAELPGAGPVRLWPHHFDIATLFPLSDGNGEDAPSLGFGLSPGDGSYPEPYWYVLPWPAPGDARLGELASGGTWHREGWIGAVLTSSAVAALEDEQRDGVRAFLDSARDAGRRALGRAP